MKLVQSGSLSYTKLLSYSIIIMDFNFFLKTQQEVTVYNKGMLTEDTKGQPDRLELRLW